MTFHFAAQINGVEASVYRLRAGSGARFNATWTGPNNKGVNEYPHLYAELWGTVVNIDVVLPFLRTPPRPMRLRKGYR